MKKRLEIMKGDEVFDGTSWYHVDEVVTREYSGDFLWTTGIDGEVYDINVADVEILLDRFGVWHSMRPAKRD